MRYYDVRAGEREYLPFGKGQVVKIALLHNSNRDGDVDIREFATDLTVTGITRALSVSHKVQPIDCRRNIEMWLDDLTQFAPDLIFSLAEGYPSAAREAFYPALYEQLGIPYCGSDPTTLLITHNKALTERIVEAAGLTVPWSATMSCEEDIVYFRDKLPFPVIVKPNSEGSSIGIDERAVAHTIDEVHDRVNAIWNRFCTLALVEEYISPGVDCSMSFVEGLGADGVFGPVVYAYPEGEVFSYELKSRSYAQSILSFPETITAEIAIQLHDDMLRAVHALDVRGYGRADFRVVPGGSCYFIEMNGQPQEMGPKRSDFMAPVLRAGYAYEKVVLHIAEYAAAKAPRRPSAAGLQPQELIVQRTGIGVGHKVQNDQ